MYEEVEAIMPVHDAEWDVRLRGVKLNGEGPAMMQVRMTYQINDAGEAMDDTVIGFMIPTDVGCAVAPNHPDSIWEAAADTTQALRLLGERLEELGLI